MSNPLALFGLMFLAITEGVIRLATTKAFDASGALMIVAVYVLLFLFTEIGVLIVVWFRPKNMTYGQEGHLTEAMRSTKNKPLYENEGTHSRRRATLRQQARSLTRPTHSGRVTVRARQPQLDSPISPSSSVSLLR